MTEETMMDRIARGIELGQIGQRPEAVETLTQLWSELDPDGNPLHRVAVAHSLADLQDDPNIELSWDLRALEQSELVTDTQTHEAGMTSGPAGMQPSLHLNLADVYLRLGQPDNARVHVAEGMQHVDALNDDGYGRMIRAGLERVTERLYENPM